MSEAESGAPGLGRPTPVAPRVSVIIPTRNRALKVTHAIASAFASGRAVGVIVVDDASSDDTRAVCASIEGIRYIRNGRPLGPSGARNVGLKACASEYVAFLDDDDTLLAGALDALGAVLDANPSVALVYGSVYLMTEGTNARRTFVAPRDHSSGDIFEQLLEGNHIFINSVLVRTRQVIEAGCFDVNLSYMEDWDLWIRIAERHPVASTPEPVATVREPDLFSGQLSSNRALMVARSLHVQERGLDLPRGRALSAARRRQLRQSFVNKSARALLLPAVRAASRGAFALACDLATTSLRLMLFPDRASRIADRITAHGE